MKLSALVKSLLFTLVLAFTVSACHTLTYPMTATSNPVGSKIGTSQITYVMGFPGDTDASIRTAAINGNITKISTVDIEIEQIAIFYYRMTTIVSGE